MEENLEKNKLNKGFKMLFIINSCVFLAAILPLIVGTSNFGIAIIIILNLFICSVVSLILLIITTILGINNYRKNQNRKIRNKIIIMLSSIIILHIGSILGFIGITHSNNSSKTSVGEEQTVILTERQKKILEEKGLSTDFNKLGFRQKEAITAIEEMLCVVEEKYGISFEYISYDAGWILDDSETLMAYPSTGDPDYDSFSVTRELENGEYIYEDGYAQMITSPVLSKFVQNYCEERLGQENVKVYSIVFTIKTEKFPISIENVKGNIDGNNWIFINGEAISEEKYEIFISELRTWLNYNEIFGSNQVILLKDGVLKYLTEYNYDDYLSEDYYTRREDVNL